jgi:hypothetical protein
MWVVNHSHRPCQRKTIVAFSLHAADTDDLSRQCRKTARIPSSARMEIRNSACCDIKSVQEVLACFESLLALSMFNITATPAEQSEP